MDERFPAASAIAIRGNRILALGSVSDLERHRGADTRVVDLGGRTVVPGFIDAHMHFSRLGKRLRTLFLDEAADADAVVAIAKQQALITRAGDWIVGRGWHTVAWPGKSYPTHDKLSAVTPKHPVYLAGMANHAAWVNRRAMEIAGIDRDTPDPPDGRIVKDPDTGEPTGILIEGAKSLVQKHLPPEGKDRMKKDILAGVDVALRLGITSIHDAGVGDEEVAIYRELRDGGKLGVRLYVMRYVENPAKLDSVLKHEPEVGPRLSVKAIKVYADGALGARGAALLQPYADRPGESGLVANDREALFEIMSKASKAGYQVAVHAIGDRGNRNVLDVVERLQVATKSPLRVRIEHAQVLSPNDIARFGRLGVVPVMQPIHATMDKGFAEDRLGRDRLAGAYAWKSLMTTGARVAGSADTPAFPIYYSNPIVGIHAAVTRQDAKGRPEGGWLPKERVTRMEALAMYTTNAAYAAFEEDDKGTISPGKLADLTVLSADILTISAPEILSTSVYMTIVDGEVVFQAQR